MALNGIGDWGVNGPTDQPPDPSVPGSQVPARFGSMSPQETLSWVYDPTRNPGMRYDPSRGLMWQWAPPVEGGTKYILMEGQYVPYQEEATPGRWVSFSGSPTMAQGAIDSYNQYSTPDPGLADWGTVATGLGAIAGMGALGGAFSAASPWEAELAGPTLTSGGTATGTTIAPSVANTVASAINPSAVAQGAVKGVVGNAVTSTLLGGTPNPLLAATMGAAGPALGGVSSSTGIPPEVVKTAASAVPAIVAGADPSRIASVIGANYAGNYAANQATDWWNAPSTYTPQYSSTPSSPTFSENRDMSGYNFTFDNNGNLIDSTTGQPFNAPAPNDWLNGGSGQVSGDLSRYIQPPQYFGSGDLTQYGNTYDTGVPQLVFDQNSGAWVPSPGVWDTGGFPSGGVNSGGSTGSGGVGGAGGASGGVGGASAQSPGWWQSMTQNSPWLPALIASMIAGSNNTPAPITQSQATSSTTGARAQGTTSVSGPSTTTGSSTTGPSTQTGTSTSGPSTTSTNQTVGPSTTTTSPTSLLPDLANTATLNAAIQAAITPIRQSFFDPGGTLSQIRTDFGDQYGSTRHQLAEAVAASREQQNELNTAAQIANALYGTNLQYELNRGIANQGKTTSTSGVNTTGTTTNSGQTNTNQLFNSGATTTSNQTNSGQTNTSASTFSPTTTSGSTSSSTQLPATPWWQSAIGGALATQSLVNAINNPQRTATPVTYRV